MLELELTVGTAQRVRFAVSPAQELFSAVQAASARRPPSALHAWAVTARQALRACAVDELVAALSGERYAPDFLTPPPDRADTTLDEQLGRAAATPPEQVDLELRLAFADRPWPSGLPRSPIDARDLLVAQLASCWAPLLGAWWPAARSILDADIAHRAGRLARGGVVGALGSLHPSIALVDGSLRIGADHPCPVEALDDRGLLLLPSVFAADDAVGPIVIGYWQPSLVYPARGRGNLCSGASTAPTPLAELLGHTRARVFAALVSAQTTTGLSHQLRLSVSAVSEHLHALHRMGLCSRRRAGRTVTYEINDRGRQVLTAYVT